MQNRPNDQHTDTPETPGRDTPATVPTDEKPHEHGGPAGLEPTRYGDWERKGRCIDF